VIANDIVKPLSINVPLARQPFIDDPFDDFLHDNDGEWGAIRPLGVFSSSCWSNLSLTQRFYT
jgi:hypothetical protein